ncbi:MAG: protein-export chaperone SecB [Chitinophagaceae bacterium]|nr:protein-export chaperone SecB [Chitinophagaceae bacterium]
MTIKQSPLELKEFNILNVDCRFVAPKIEVDVEKLFNSYEIDINFAIRQIAEGTVYVLFVKAEINYEVPPTIQKEGYEMYIESVGVFSVKDTKISDEEKLTLLTNSGLVMVLNFLRTKLADITAHFPMGKYYIPSIDLKDLVEKKQKTLHKASVKNKKRKSA